MGVKSTIHLTREQAIQKGADLYEAIHRRKTEAVFHAMNDAQIEEALEEMKDHVNGGEGLENYVVST